ncbi:monoglyceride lipase-like [Dysidea avara]|uniref:monoglyceride lipase-like n=1 Tax=Dysidea avara TaxID=196820 RepID=UPI0033196E87
MQRCASVKTICNTMAECCCSSIKNKDGLTVFTRSWMKDKCNPKAVLFISHGVTEHCGRFHKLATILQENDYAVYGHDHVGHGNSDGERIHIDDYQTYVTDVIQHVELLKSKHPNLPLFIYGESMGGLITAMTVVERPDLFTGVIFSAPAIVNVNVGFFKYYVLKVVSYFAPHHIVLPYVPKIITSDPEEVKGLIDDSLICQDGLKAKWSLATLDAQYKVQQRIPEIQLPFITLHGSKDRVVDIVSSHFLMDHAKSEDKMMKVFEGSRHTLLHDIHKEEATQVVLEWLNKHCNKDASKL